MAVSEVPLYPEDVHPSRLSHLNRKLGELEASPSAEFPHSDTLASNSATRFRLRRACVVPQDSGAPHTRNTPHSEEIIPNMLNVSVQKECEIARLCTTTIGSSWSPISDKFGTTENPVHHSPAYCDISRKSRSRLKSILPRSLPQTWKHLVTLLTLASLCPGVPGQSNPRCVRPGVPQVVEETTPVGTVLLTVPAEPDMTWRFSFGLNLDQLTQYLEFNRSQTENTFVLTLAKPMDVEEIHGLLGTNFEGVTTITLYCKEPNRAEKSSSELFEVREVNEFSPEFNTSNIEISIKENTPPGTPLLTLIDWASDKDVNYRTREISDFSLAPVGTDPQALQILEVLDTSRGVVGVREDVDFDTLPADSRQLVLQLQVKDTGGLTGNATLTATIEDVDDLPPFFFYSGCSDPCTVAYRAFLSPNFTGEVDRIEPSTIQAKDGDSLNYRVTYHLVQGPDNFPDYILLDPSTAQLTVVKQLKDLGLDDLAFIVEAREVSVLRRSSQASLLISLGGVIGGVGAVASARTDDAILVAAIVLGILFFIVVVCLIAGAVLFRKKYKTPVHPEGRQPIRKDESPMAEESPGSRCQPPVPISGTGFGHHLSKSGIRENGLLGGDHRNKSAVRGEDDLITWMPIAAINDIVDLSDEDTIKKKKKMNVAPPDTQLQTRDPHGSQTAAEKDLTQRDSCPETEYAELDTPPRSRKGQDRITGNPAALDSPNDLPVMLINKTYATAAPDPPARRGHQLQSFHPDDDTEYATPRETTCSSSLGIPEARNSQKSDEPNINRSDQDDGHGSYSNKAFVKDEPQRKPPRRPGSKKPKPARDDRSVDSVAGDFSQPTASSDCYTSSAADDPESQSFHSSDGSPTGSGPLYTAENETPRLPPHRQWLTSAKTEKTEYNDCVESEETEYSVPTSNRSSYVLRSLPVPEDNDQTTVASDSLKQTQHKKQEDVKPSAQRGNKPSLPPKPASKDQLLNPTVVEEPPYATIDKLKKSPTSPKAPEDNNDDADQSGEGEGSSANDSSSHKTGSASIVLQAPARRKRPRKRSKQPRAPEEDVYDGTKDYEDLEVDSGFYTDTTKTKIKRSSRLPVMKPDPNDTRYWITVSNDY